MENKIKKTEIDGEAIYMKKGGLGWKVVYPIKNEDGTLNKKHLIAGGSWWNLVVILFLVFIAVGFIWEYHQNTKLCTQIINYYNGMNISIIGLEQTPDITIPNIPEALDRANDIPLGVEE